MTTKITGIVRDLEGQPLVNSHIRFERRSGVRGQDGATVVPRVVNAKTDSGGNIAVDLYPGEYTAQAERGSGALSFKVGVPEDVAQVQLNDLIDQVPFITPSWTSETRQARDEAVAAAESTAGSVEAAATSETNAANSATAAATSETNAATSESNAGQSAQDAQDAADSIPTVPFGLEDGGTGADTAEGARGNLGLGTAATENDDRYAHRANNLSDLTNTSTARSNLGLGSAATQNDTRYAHRSNNLSDLSSSATARNNLGLGTAAEADIVGTVSQSGGDPTGAVIERGSNDNGEYTRFADGTQVCSSFAVGGDEITFPVLFAADPTPRVAVAPRGSSPRIAVVRSSTVDDGTGFRLITYDLAGETSSTNCHWIAFGRVP